MAVLLIAVSVPDAEPTLEDPHDVALDIIETVNEDRHANGKTGLDFRSAEWES